MKRRRVVKIPTAWVVQPRFKKGDRVFGEFGDEGFIERILPPKEWSGGQYRYLVRFVTEHDDTQHVTKLQYGERELIANAKKYAKKR
jgi:hypothetical protein